MKAIAILGLLVTLVGVYLGIAAAKNLPPFSPATAPSESTALPTPVSTITSPGTGSEPGEVIDTLTPALQWSSVSGADYYALTISKYPYDSGNIIYNPQQVTGTSHVVPSGILVAGERYRWNMQAHGPGGWSAVSNTLYFQAPPPLQQPPAGVKPISKVIAWDDFESGTWEGGSGWLSPWEQKGYYEVKLSSKAKQGVYAAVVWGKKDGSYIVRRADLSSAVKPRLQFWGKAVDFWFNALNLEEEDSALVQISSDGENWQTVSAWFHKDDGEPYRFVDVDISYYAGVSEFWIKISVFYNSIQMIGDYPMFYIDDIKVVDMG